jgi:hypothetical protein
MLERMTVRTRLFISPRDFEFSQLKRIRWLKRRGREFSEEFRTADVQERMIAFEAIGCEPSFAYAKR